MSRVFPEPSKADKEFETIKDLIDLLTNKKKKLKPKGKPRIKPCFTSNAKVGDSNPKTDAEPKIQTPTLSGPTQILVHVQASTQSETRVHALAALALAQAQAQAQAAKTEAEALATQAEVQALAARAEAQARSLITQAQTKAQTTTQTQRPIQYQYQPQQAIGVPPSVEKTKPTENTDKVGCCCF